MSAPRDDDPVGPAVQEAARLLVALVDRARDNLGAEPGASGHLGALGDLGGAGQAAECRWCPLCQAIAFVRATSPETRQQVTGAAAALVLALRDLADSAAADSPGGGSEGDSDQAERGD